MYVIRCVVIMLGPQLLPYVCAAYAVTVCFIREISVKSEEGSVPPSVCTYISILSLMQTHICEEMHANSFLARNGFEKPFDNIQ